MSSIPESLKPMLRFLKRNPVMGVTTGTAVLCLFYGVYSGQRASRQLLATQRVCVQTAESGFQDCREMLKAMDQNWAKDLKSRDNSVRRLELQNVEQTRSIARLDSAMKMCFNPSPNSPQAP